MVWHDLLSEEFAKLSDSLYNRARDERTKGWRICPGQDVIFRALELTPPDKVKAVIIGQDPYHTPGNSGSHSRPSTPNAPAPSTPASSTPAPTVTETTHTHNWVQKTRTVHHEATGHYEDVVISEAWDEPVYTTVWKSICNGCGADITANPAAHCEERMLAGHLECSGHADLPFNEITGYIHHDAVTESRWVEDTAAYDETVIDGYVCSGCGAVK